MQSEITIEKVWNDEDVTEFEIKICNGRSVFCNKVYSGIDELGSIIVSLDVFRNHCYGGLLDINLGRFGREYASGAVFARLHFPKPGKLYISTHQQSGFFKFNDRAEASECKMYLSTEPVLLDNFIQELKVLNLGASSTAKLICI